MIRSGIVTQNLWITEYTNLGGLLESGSIQDTLSYLCAEPLDLDMTPAGWTLVGLSETKVNITIGDNALFRDVSAQLDKQEAKIREEMREKLSKIADMRSALLLLPSPTEE